MEDASVQPPITTLTGFVDQATLRGVLNRIWDLNLTLVFVVPAEARGRHDSEGGGL